MLFYAHFTLKVARTLMQWAGVEGGKLIWGKWAQYMILVICECSGKKHTPGNWFSSFAGRKIYGRREVATVSGARLVWPVDMFSKCSRTEQARVTQRSPKGHQGIKQQEPPRLTNSCQSLSKNTSQEAQPSVTKGPPPPHWGSQA